MFLRIRLVCPSSDEQDAIISFVQHESTNIDHLSLHVKEKIELLHEYRTRLISDVVTGKLDVREAAAHLPESDPSTVAANCQDGTELADRGRSPHP